MTKSSRKSGIPQRNMQEAGECQNHRKTIINPLGICVLSLFLVLSLAICQSPAQDEDKLTALSKQAIEAKPGDDLYAPFEGIKEIYFSQNKYNEFIGFLNSLVGKNKEVEPFINYYISLSRYYQLRYLEVSQSWNEYFSKGDTYRDQILSSALKARDASGAGSLINVYAKLILWRFHNEAQDNSAEAALAELTQGAKQLPATKNVLANIKYIADLLFSYKEKVKAKELYGIYVERLLGLGLEAADLKNNAAAFFKEGNLELAEALYDAYIEKEIASLPAGNLSAFLKDDLALIAASFTRKDFTAADPVYAERCFKKIEDAGGRGVFSEETTYLRALNLEKSGNYLKAKDIYLDLLSRFPAGEFADTANFKAAVILTYITHELVSGRSSFEALAKKDSLSPQAISAHYQLGIISQWQGDSALAKEYYDLLIQKAGDKFADTVSLAKDRLGEIQQSLPLEYNLKTFLDICLNNGQPEMALPVLDLTSAPLKVKNNSDINIKTAAWSLDSGCAPVELQYLWSGNLGKNKPPLDQPSFNTSFDSPGTKEINLVVIGPSGAVAFALDLLDIE